MGHIHRVRDSHGGEVSLRDADHGIKVDGRDQHCALVAWLLVLALFSLYGCYVFMQAVAARAHPSQSVEFVNRPYSIIPQLVR